MLETSYRSHTVGSIGMSLEGKSVTLCGWVETIRDHGGVLFFHLRDASGRLQVLLDPNNMTGDQFNIAQQVHIEYCVRVNGLVVSRPEGKDRTWIDSKDVELEAKEIEILGSSETLPFRPQDHSQVGEEQRLTHRYIDLRSDEIQKSLRMRSTLLHALRSTLQKRHFVEVETPILSKSTPEGARDFLVPSRIHHGSFYALPQSPQLFKQLLMIGGMDRYFQIARCFRDEDQRTNRQPEFTQLDLEMSFVNEQDVMDEVEKLVLSALWDLNCDVKSPFKRLSDNDAMNIYGTDAPDLTFDLPIQDLTSIFQNTQFKVFRKIVDQGGIVRALVLPSEYNATRSDIEWVRSEIAKLGVAEPAWGHLRASGFESTISKFWSNEEIKAVSDLLAGGQDELVFFMAGPSDRQFKEIIGKLRLAMRDRFKISSQNSNTLAFVWVTDFPLFDWDNESKKLTYMHHPFTSPCDTSILNENDRDLLLQAHSKAYDLVLNGQELGSGSIRIHNVEIQKQVFRKLGISEEYVNENFGFFLRALEYGAPPHGGIALGMDRFVAVLMGLSSIRDTIAFPKNKNSHCPLTMAPSGVEFDQLRDCNITIREKS